MKMMCSLVILAVSALLFDGCLCANPADFTVHGVDGGKTFRLSEARGKYVALHFLLKTTCPYCLKHTQEYIEKAPTVPGVIHVFLKPDTDEEIKAWAGKLGDDTMTIYRDPEAELAKQFKIPDGYKFHGQVVHFPAFVLLDPAGKEVFRYVGKSNRDRFSFDQFAQKMAELTKGK